MKKYIAELDFYVLAKNDTEAKKEIKEITDYLKKKYDNSAKLQRLYQQFGLMEFKKL